MSAIDEAEKYHWKLILEPEIRKEAVEAYKAELREWANNQIKEIRSNKHLSETRKDAAEIEVRLLLQLLEGEK